MTGMDEGRRPADQAVRDRALSPQHSFIVQAPAGSGKTGLLTQRYLTLLAYAGFPEEIVAITFTRKAASEMHGRILDALHRARNAASKPADAYTAKTLALAEAALLRSESEGWELLSNPGRLRIQTIDSLCLELARQMPLLSQLGALPATREMAQPLYVEAAVAVLAEIDRDDSWGRAATGLLQHLDNDQVRMQMLIAEMLARRDQWLRHLGDPEAVKLERSRIEAALDRVVRSALDSVLEKIPSGIETELCELVRFAATNLDADSVLINCRGLLKFSDNSPCTLKTWLGLSELLLTTGGEWRQKGGVNARIGFPAPKSGAAEKVRCAEMKARMQDMLAQLAEASELKMALQALRALPQPAYTDDEWSVLEMLFRVLLRAATHLLVVFGKRGEMDFIEAALRANRALVEGETYSELALRLDYQVRHVLVDEFQDTSQNQYDLFRHLTRGWEPGDGRTLFLVGDPMQSIYRFREAEVGLFLQAWQGGLGEVPLEPLRLEVNFRSQAGIVEWVNGAFSQVLPATSDATSGAVAYAPFSAWHPVVPGDAVTVHPFLDVGPREEAARILEVVQRIRQESPQDSIAVLVRARSHLREIVAALDAARREGNTVFGYRAVEISPLANRQTVLDMLALTRALLHPADRIAWLALLRAPFCGLKLADLHKLAENSSQQVMLESMRMAKASGELSEDGMARLSRVLPVVEDALSLRGRRPLRQWIEGTWLALGGPACPESLVELEDAEAFLSLLEDLAEIGETPGAAILAECLQQLYAQPANQDDGTLQLMTMHKAKGLEFDTVILPGLGRRPAADSERMLYWLEQQNPTGGAELLLGPIRGAGQPRNATSAYIEGLERRKGEFEAGRLLYVAATRARRRLHLLGQVSTGKGGALRPPARGCLLHYLWPVAAGQFASAAGAGGVFLAPAVLSQGARESTARARLPAHWTCPPPPGAVPDSNNLAGQTTRELAFDWAGQIARQAGVVAHRILQHLAERGVETEQGRCRLIAYRMLLQAGLGSKQVELALERVMTVLRNTLEDPRGRWILGQDRFCAECEMAITTSVGGELQYLVIDRTFVDDMGIRWVIDYKTGSHEGGDTERFLQQELERYRPQLEGYGRALAAMGSEPVRMGLYFPLLRGWREWPLDG